jgi:SAM-dependent methyltransferase
MRTLVRQRRPRLLAAARGDVLELGNGTDGEGPYDTVVSVLHLSSVDDPEAELARVREVLAPGGSLLFLELDRDPGLPGRGQQAVAPLTNAVTGWRPDRDILGLLRRSGFAGADLIRLDLPRYRWPLRTVVEGRAVVRPRGS